MATPCAWSPGTWPTPRGTTGRSRSSATGCSPRSRSSRLPGPGRPPRFSSSSNGWGGRVSGCRHGTPSLRMPRRRSAGGVGGDLPCMRPSTRSGGRSSDPLIFTAIILAQGDYRSGFAILAVPFVLMILALLFARRRRLNRFCLRLAAPPIPAEPASRGGPCSPPTASSPRSPWPDLRRSRSSPTTSPSPAWSQKQRSPLFYAVAMGVDAIAALTIGRAYDRFGLVTLLSVPLLAIGIPFLAFGTSYALALAAVVLWGGAAMGAQETILRAAVADYTHISKRGTAYGIFNTVYGGAAWFAGSAVIGWAYTVAVPLVVGFMVVMQVGGALAAFAWMRRGFAAPAG
ncbi:hypothetical protein [Methanoculleus chikugoensis]|uniref:hypothetical protein n=1 Tax=Methanoculleus chikugoensis TaxID=118126 RepID=UPI001FB1EE40|nr:hypothetical protein [Methanoculleus chikugoensis]